MGTGEKVCVPVQCMCGSLPGREEILKVPYLMKGILKKGIIDKDPLLLQNVLLQIIHKKPIEQCLAHSKHSMIISYDYCFLISI